MSEEEVESLHNQGIGSRPPILTPIGNKFINESQLLTFEVSATDSDGDILTYSTSTLPDGATFDAVSGTFDWTPTAGQAGEYFITFTVSDGDFTDNETITITVNPYFYNSLAGHWKLDDNSDNKIVADSSGNGNNGTAQHNTSALHTIGQIDGAFTFNGTSDYIDCGSEDIFQERSVLTISAWINGSDYTKPYNMIVCGDQGNLDFSWGLRVDNGIVKFFVRANGYKVATGNSLSTGQWYHVVGVWDRNGGANNLKIYVDGQLKGQTTVNEDMDASTVSVCIGRVYFPRINQYFNGLIDDIMAFDEALSADEIQALYNEGIGI